MSTILTLMDLAGAIALLIWGVHMVQTGIMRAIGPQLRRILGYTLGNRLKRFWPVWVQRRCCRAALLRV